jgi:hypothetical protein
MIRHPEIGRGFNANIDLERIQGFNMFKKKWRK